MEEQPQAPATAEPTATPVAEPKSKMSKKQIIGMTVLTIIAIAGVAFGVFGMVDSSSKNNEIAEYKSKIALLEQETGAKIVEQDDIAIVDTASVENEDDKVKAIVTKVYEGLRELDEHSVFFKVFGEGSMVKIPDSEVYTLSNKSYGVHSASDESLLEMMSNKAYPVVKAILESNGYSLQKETMWGGVFYNENDGIFCMADSGSVPYEFNCSSEKWIDDEVTALVLNLAKVSDSSYIYALPDEIEDSTIAPYQKLTASIDNAAGLFYRVSPDSEWQFFIGTQGVLSCDEFTGDVAKAYAGETCWNEASNSNSTVQP